MRKVDVGWWLRILALRLDEPGLEMDDVLAQAVVLRLDGLVVLFQGVKLTNLLLKLLDITFLTLPKCSLFPNDQKVSYVSKVVRS